MHVHCGSRARLGEAGVLKGFLFVLNFCLFGGSSFSEYEDDAFLENLNEGEQHSLNCFASMGEVKFNPHVSLVMGSFQ
jgi:hypothetical protein